jgi:Tol biopolymer transport system component/DNA-binding winged helix-turn-helix (wHTH) protein
MAAKLLRFGLFELNTAARQLEKQGRRVRLQEQPLRILEMLLERPGELVTRQELRQRLWPSDVYVDFERGLNGAIKRLRLALGDSADNPRFIATVTKSGYRFIAPVQSVSAVAEDSIAPVMQASPRASGVTAAAAPSLQPPAPAPVPQSAKNRVVRPLIVACILAAIALVAYLLRPLDPPLRVTRIVKLSNSGHAWSGENLMTDGARLYYSEAVLGKDYRLRQILLNGNEDMPVAGLPSNFLIRDLSPDHTTFLGISRSAIDRSDPSPLWMVPVVGGQPRRIGGLLAKDVAWSPDGSLLAFDVDEQLFLARPDGTAERRLATVPGHLSFPRWSPDGARLRFNVADFTGQLTIWEVNKDGSDLHPLELNWPGGAMEGFGAWSPDGRYYVFTSQREGISNLWFMDDESDWLHRRRLEPAQLTAGPIHYFRPLPSADGTQIFAVGLQFGGELVRYDVARRNFAPFLGGRSADQLSFSRDGQWVAYVGYPDGTLWRARSDGSQVLQLTFPPLRVTNPQWSPDGKRVLFVLRRSGEMPKLYTISSDGGNPEILVSESHAQTSAGWSPDGEFIFYGRDPYDEQQDIALYRFEVKSGRVERIPGSDGLFAPLCSPDGHWLITQTTASDHVLVLFDLKTGQRTNLSQRKGDYPFWSPDSQYVYFNTLMAGPPGIFRLHVPDGKETKIMDVDFATTGVFGRWSGLAPDGSILLLRDHQQSDVYELTVKRGN